MSSSIAYVPPCVAISTAESPSFSVMTTRVVGVEEAMFGLSLSYNKDYAHMFRVADRLAHKGNGHNKFLESICAWQDITAARDWWSQFDTYRIDITKQSESTMHTISKKPLTQENFAIRIKEDYLEYLNYLIEDKAPVAIIKKALPESFLQRRIVRTNYMTLQAIVRQRHNHKLGEWHCYCEHLTRLPHSKWISTLASKFGEPEVSLA